MIADVFVLFGDCSDLAVDNLHYIHGTKYASKEGEQEREKNRDVYLIVRYPVLTVGNNLFHCPCHFL